MSRPLAKKYNLIISGIGKPDTHPEWLSLSNVGRLKQPLQCIRCGVKGTIILRHRHANEPETAVHHDVFGVNQHNKYVMITVDHILPKSWGGNNFKSNKQVMCHSCNTGKGMVIKRAELENVIRNIPNHLIHNGYAHSFVINMTKQHKDLCTADNFRLIVKQLPKIVNYHDKIIDIMVDQMQNHLAKHS